VGTALATTLATGKGGGFPLPSNPTYMETDTRIETTGDYIVTSAYVTASPQNYSAIRFWDVATGTLQGHWDLLNGNVGTEFGWIYCDGKHLWVDMVDSTLTSDGTHQNYIVRVDLSSRWIASGEPITELLLTQIDQKKDIFLYNQNTIGGGTSWVPLSRHTVPFIFDGKDLWFMAGTDTGGDSTKGKFRRILDIYSRG